MATNGEASPNFRQRAVDTDKQGDGGLARRIAALEDRLAAGEASPRKRVPNSSRVANTGPLGLYAFGYTTALLAAEFTAWTDGTVHHVYGMAIFFGGLAQLLAGMWAIYARNGFAGTAFTAYGAFWMGFALHGILVDSGVLVGEELQGEQTFLALWAVFTFCLFLQTFNINIALMLLFLFLTLAFALLAPGDGYPRVHKAGGYFAFAAAVMAFYTGTAEITNEVYRRTILPMGVLNLVTAQPESEEPHPDTL